MDEQAHEIRVLCDYREQLMHERNRLINRLRCHLVRIAPHIETQLGPAALKGPRIRGVSLVSSVSSPPARSCSSPKSQLRRINEITKEQLELFAELTELRKQHAPQALEQRSIATVTAAVIIGRTAGTQRFRSEPCFARHIGTARSPPPPARRFAIGYTAAVTDNLTAPSTHRPRPRRLGPGDTRYLQRK